jgi:phage shock protein C
MGIDPMVVRIAFVVATLIGGWPWTVIAYIVLAMAGKPKRAPLRRGAVAYEGLQECGGLSDLDRRMAEIDHHYVASSNSRLAREIEELR